jgi:hypothetical protein
MLGAALLLVLASGALYLLVSLAGGLEGTDITERDISRQRQLELINEFAPAPVPDDAADIRLRYQRFQDWRFEASFSLRAEQLEGFVGGLQPGPGPGVYVGKQIGPHVGTVRADRASGRVVVIHTSS